MVQKQGDPSRAGQGRRARPAGAGVPMGRERGRARLSAAFLATLLALSACGRPIQPVLEPDKWDFGTVSAGAPLERELEIGNPGRRRLVVSLVSTCDCLVVTPKRLELPAGGRESITMRYDPSEDEGEVRMQVIVRGGEGRGVSRMPLPVFGHVVPVGSGGRDATAEQPAGAGAGTRPPDPTDSQPALSFDYFYDPGCRECEAFIRGKTWLWEQELGARIEVRWLDLSDPEIMALYERRLEVLGIEERAYPAAVFGGVVLQGYDEIGRELKGLLEQSLASEKGSHDP